MWKVFDRPIAIQRIDEATEKWETVFELHAYINKAKTDTEYLSAGAIQGKRSLVFEVRYFKEIESIDLDTQSYRVLYKGVAYNIKDYDDYQLRHRTIKLLGESYYG